MTKSAAAPAPMRPGGRRQLRSASHLGCVNGPIYTDCPATEDGDT
jgi:hypothetical protein